MKLDFTECYSYLIVLLMSSDKIYIHVTFRLMCIVRIHVL